MADFTAKITAELDTSKAEQQINSLGKDKKVKLDVDVGSSSKNVKNLDNNINTTTKDTKSLGNALKSALGIGSAAAIAAKSIRTVSSLAKEALETVEDIDAAMTQLQIVTGATGNTLNSYLNNSISLAKELGQSVDDVVESITTFSRLGYNFTDSSQLAEYAAILSNIANVTTDAATTGLTSIIKGYSFDTSDAEHVADVLTEIGQSYAVSASELITAYEKAGAALNASGTSFEKSAALIAAANASVQDASTVGTALKTISARIRGATTELEEMGEDASDLADGYSKYAEEIEALTGFSILEEGTTDTYKDIYDIFEGIASCWNSLSDTSQARVAEILGGTRQLTVVSSIMSNWKDAAGAYEDAINSAGVATAANEVYMDSLEAKLAQLKAAFQELSTDTLSSDMIGNIVELATSIVELTDKTNILQGTMAGLATAAIVKGFTMVTSGATKAAAQMSNFGNAMTLLKNTTAIGTDDLADLCIMTQNLSNSQLKAVVSSQNLTTQQRMTILTSTGLSEAEAGAALSAMGLATSEGVAATSTFSLSAAFKGLTATLVANPFIAIVAGVTAVVSAYSTYQQKIEEVRESAEELGSTFSDTVSDIEDYKEQIKELYETINDSTSSVDDTTEAREELLSIQEALIESYGSEADAVNIITEAINGESDALDELLQKEWQQVKNEFNESGIGQSIANALDGYENNMERIIDEWENYSTSIDFSSLFSNWNTDEAKEFQDLLTENGFDLNEIGRGIELSGDVDEVYDQILSLQNLLADNSEYTNATISNQLTKAANSADEMVDSYEDLYNQHILYDKIFENDAYSDYYKDLIDAYEEYEDAYASGDITAVNEAINNYEQALNEAKAAATEAGDNGVAEYFDEMYPALEATAESINDVTDAVESSLQSFSEYWASEDFSEYATKLLNLAKSGELTEETLETTDDYKTLLEETGLSASEAKTEIMNLLDVTEKLSSASNGFEDLYKAYDDFSDYGFVLADTLTTLEDTSWGELEGWDVFEEIASDSTKTAEEIKAAFNDIATEYVISESTLTGLLNASDAEVQSYISNLTEMGVTNAEEFVSSVQSILSQMEAWGESTGTEITNTLANQAIELASDIDGTFDDLETSLINSYQTYLETKSDSDLEYYENLVSNDSTLLASLGADYETDVSNWINALQAKTDAYNEWVEAIAASQSDILTQQALNGSYSSGSIENGSIIDSIFSNSTTTAAVTASVNYKKAQAEYDQYLSNLKLDLKSISLDFDSINYDGTTSSNKTSTSGGSSSSSKTFDWIERKIKKLTDAYDKLNTKAESTYNTFSTRNKALSSEYSNITQQISTYQKAYSAYMKEANSLGLSSYYKNLVQSGSYNISDITDDTLADKITKYQEYYDNAQDCLQSVQDLQVQLGDIMVEKFELVQTKYENKLSTLEATATSLENNLSLAESKADATYKSYSSRSSALNSETSYYKKLQTNNASQLKLLKQEKSALESQLNAAVKNGSIKTYSEEWYELKSKIADVSEAIQDCNQKTQDYKDALAQIQLDKFNLIVEQYENKISSYANAITKAENKISLAESKATATYSTYSSRTSAYNSESSYYSTAISTTKAEKSTYQTELKKLQSQLASAEKNGITKYSSDWYDLKNSIADVEQAIQECDQALQDYNESLAQLEMDKFDLIVEKYENKIGVLEDAATSLEKSIDLAESRATATRRSYSSRLSGYTSETEYYTSLKSNANSQKKQYQAELKALQEQLDSAVSSGKIKENSSDWYEMKSQIAAVEQAIQDCTQSVQDYNDALADIEMDKFDLIVEKYDNAIGKIEDAITKYENYVQLAESKADASYTSYSDRNAAYESEYSYYSTLVKKTNSEITKLEAEKEELEEQMASAIETGLFSTTSTDYYDMLSQIESVSQQIQECEQDLQDYSDSVVEVAISQFDLVKEQYDNIVDVLDNSISLIDSYMSLVEAQGKTISASYYTAQNSLLQTTLENLQAERDELDEALTNAMKNGVEYGSSDYWELYNQIVELDQDIIETETEIQENLNEIRQIEWDNFDSLEDAISDVADEAEFLIGLLESSDLYTDNGQLTDEGLATLGLYAEKYNLLMNQADDYANAIAELDAELADDPYNQDLIDRRAELVGLQQEAIEAAQDEKDAIVDLVEEGIEAELDSLQSLIDAYEESLDSAKDLYDYQKNIAETTENISELQKTISAYENDDSEETKAKIQQLKVELEEAEDDLEEQQYEQYIEDQKELLESLYDDYELILNSRLDDIDGLISDMIEAVNENAGTISSTLISLAESVGYTLSDETLSIWSGSGSTSISDVVSTYGSDFSSKLTTVNTTLATISSNVAAMVSDADSSASANLSNVSGYSSGGIVGGLQKIAQLNGDDSVTINTLKTGEAILTPEQTQLFEELISNLPVLQSSLDLSGELNGLGNGVNISAGDSHYEINIGIDHVDGYNDFISQLTTDSKFKTFLEDITINRIAGGSSLASKRHKWN